MKAHRVPKAHECVRVKRLREDVRLIELTRHVYALHNIAVTQNLQPLLPTVNMSELGPSRKLRLLSS